MTQRILGIVCFGVIMGTIASGLIGYFWSGPITGAILLIFVTLWWLLYMAIKNADKNEGYPLADFGDVDLAAELAEVRGLRKREEMTIHVRSERIWRRRDAITRFLRHIGIQLTFRGCRAMFGWQKRAKRKRWRDDDG